MQEKKELLTVLFGNGLNFLFYKRRDFSMKYYSETLKKIYDTQEELISAECAYKKKLEEQKKKEAEKAERLTILKEEKEKRLQEINEARETYYKLLKSYWNDYGDYNTNSIFHSLFDIIGFGE